MISTQWIYLGLVASLIMGLLMSEFVSGVIIGALLTLIADSYTEGRKRARNKGFTDS